MRIAIIGIVIVALIGGGVWYFLATSDITESPAPSPFPKVSVTTLDGETVLLPDDYAGTPFVVGVWATWCAVCTSQLDSLRILEEAHPSLVVLAVNRAEPASDIAVYLERRGIAPSDLAVVIDTDDTLFPAIAGDLPSMPQTLFVDADGTIQTHKRGSITPQEMERFASALLEV